MGAFESGVKGYVIGTVTLTNGFPIDWNGVPHIACVYCKYYSITTKRCRLNNAVIAFPDKYVGDECPLEGIETEVSEIE